MAIVQISSLSIGTQVSFKTLHPSDNNLYEGTIVGRGQYSVVKSLMDILPYYQMVKKAKPDMAPMEELDYFILEYSQEGLATNFVCANDWVNTTSVKIIQLDQYFDIRVYNRPTSEIDTVLGLLGSHGYVCSSLTVE